MPCISDLCRDTYIHCMHKPHYMYAFAVQSLWSSLATRNSHLSSCNPNPDRQTYSQTQTDRQTDTDQPASAAVLACKGVTATSSQGSINISGKYGQQRSASKELYMTLLRICNAGSLAVYAQWACNNCSNWHVIWSLLCLQRTVYIHICQLMMSHRQCSQPSGHAGQCCWHNVSCCYTPGQQFMWNYCHTRLTTHWYCLLRQLHGLAATHTLTSKQQ